MRMHRRGLALVSLTCIVGCSAPEEPASTMLDRSKMARPPLTINPSLVSLANAAPHSLAPPERDNIVGAAVFRNTCALCHGPGIAGAPRLDAMNEWNARVSSGREVLYQHAIGGYRGRIGLMPPKGGNPSLSDDEIRAAVDYMLDRAMHSTRQTGTNRS